MEDEQCVSSEQFQDVQEDLAKLSSTIDAWQYILKSLLGHGARGKVSGLNTCMDSCNGTHCTNSYVRHKCMNLQREITIISYSHVEDENGQCSCDLINEALKHARNNITEEVRSASDVTGTYIS